jgi:NOL1/NOP2/fmu family ribosome biogenesis protein
MKKFKVLNTREIKRFKVVLEDTFGYSLKKDYAYLMNDRERVFLINKDLIKVDLDKLVVDRIGLYFAEYKHNLVRLSKEGAQLFVQEAKENGVKLPCLFELDKKETKAYFAGVDLKKDLGEETKTFILIHKNDVLGYAKYKEGKILNYLPKIYRGEVIL